MEITNNTSVTFLIKENYFLSLNEKHWPSYGTFAYNFGELVGGFVTLPGMW